MTFYIDILKQSILDFFWELPTYELGQMTEIPLGMHPGTIRIEKYCTKTVSIRSFLMFEKCRFCENYPVNFFSHCVHFFKYTNQGPGFCPPLYLFWLLTLSTITFCFYFSLTILFSSETGSSGMNEKDWPSGRWKRSTIFKYGSSQSNKLTLPKFPLKIFSWHFHSTVHKWIPPSPYLKQIQKKNLECGKKWVSDEEDVRKKQVYRRLF